MTYTPRPGSTGDLVLQHIRAHGPTPVSVLAAELDKSENELHSHLAWPMSRGGVKRKKVGDEWVYSEGDGVPVEDANSSGAGPQPAREAATAHINGNRVTEEQRHADERRASAPANGSRGMTPRTRGVATPPAASVEAINRNGQDRAPRAREQGRRVANAAIWMTGELAIELEDGDVLLFDKERAAALLVFFAGRAAA